MTDNDNKPHLRLPKGRLLRDAERVGDIWRRHEGKDPSLDARGAAVAPLAERYLESHGTYAGLAQLAKSSRLERDQLAAVLRDAVLRWMPSVQRDLAGFDTTGLTDSAVAEDSVHASRLLRERVNALVQDGAELPYTAELESSLVAAEERALAAASSAQAARALARQASKQRHAVAAELDDELIVFRATLRRVVGSTDADYQQLRARTGRHEQDLDEVDLEADEQPVEGEAHAEPDTDGEVGAA